jgi:hypothetical protein
MSTSQLLDDGNFGDLSPQTTPATDGTTAVTAQARVGSWSVDLGDVGLSTQNLPALAPYVDQLPPDSARYVVSLSQTTRGALSQAVSLPRAGNVFVNFYCCRNPTAGPSGGGGFAIDMVRNAADLTTEEISPFGQGVPTDGSAPVWRSHQTRFPVERSGNVYLRLVGGNDSAGLPAGSPMITSVVLHYPYDIAAKLTTPSSSPISAGVNQAFPEIDFSFTETSSDPIEPANENNALPNSPVKFQLQNGQSGIQFARGSYSTTTDAYGNARIPAGMLITGPNAGATDKILAFMGSESAGVVATLTVTGNGTPPPATNYKLLWEGAQDPLQMAQNGTGTAAFQLQTDTGTPVPNMDVLLLTGNPNGTNLQFTGGKFQYDANTDGSGNISVGLLAGNVPGDADVLALLKSNSKVSTRVDVQITEGAPAQGQYQFVWKGEQKPLSITQGGIGRAVFQLQAVGTGTPAPSVPVTLTIDPAGTGLQFTDNGALTYSNSTDSSGNISAAISAANATDQASVTASLPSDSTVSLKVGVNVTT